MKDNYDLWLDHEYKKEKWLKKRPVCSCCKEHIQEEKAVYIDNTYYCLQCIEDNTEYID